MNFNLRNGKFIIAGFFASLLLSATYFGILSVANSFAHALEQFSQMWYWILALVAGFGLQVGLYFYIRESIHQKQIKSPTVAVAASGSISTGSMVACCLHHLVDVLPLMGLAAVAVFLAQYQLFFIIIGIFSNLVGITIMLEIIQKNKLSEGFLNKILVFNMSRVRKATVALSLILILTTFFLVNNQSKIEAITNTNTNTEFNKESEPTELMEPPFEKENSIGDLTSKIDTQGGVSFQVTPLDFNFDNPLKFEVKIDTHSGSLDFDLTQISILEDDKGNKYQPSDWQGPLAGGHHLVGILLFPKLNSPTKELKLTIQDSSLRVLKWILQ